jgi:hypothetical protein
MRQIHKRLQKLKEAIRPDYNSFTLMELCRSMWQQDKDSFREMVNTKYPGLRIAIGYLEAEDRLEAADREAERTQERSR